MRSIGRSKPIGRISEAVAIAPALTIGLSGIPEPGFSVIELKASPLGSTSTCSRSASSPIASRARAKVSGLEIDWMVNSCRVSPTS